MATFPGGVYSPRTKANKSGVIYTPAKTTIGYAEDVSYLDAEVVAIETELGLGPKWDSADVKERLKGIKSLADAVQNTIVIKGNNVGIGTNSPSGLLELNKESIDSALQFILKSKDTRATNIRFESTTGLNAFIQGFHNGGSPYLSFGIAAEVIRIDSANDVSIAGGSIILDNAKPLKFKDTGGVARSAFYIDANDNTRVQAMVGGDIVFHETVVEYMRIKDGNVGIGTTNPTAPLDIKTKAGISSIGGRMIKLTNKTGNNSVKGELVEASVATANAVQLSSANSLEPIGVFLDAGVADGSEAWIVVGGIADVLADAAGFSMGDWINSSAVGGRSEGGAHIPNPAKHMQEIGHALEDAAGNNLAKIVLHFN